MLFRLIAVACLAVGPAAAGDLSPAAPSPEVVAPAPMPAPVRPDRGWTGGHVGVQLSYGDVDADQPFGVDRSTGGLYGINAGYRRDFGRLVAGGSVSYDRADLTFRDGTDVDNILRAGASLGLDLGRALPFVAGGYAAASTTNDALDFEDTFDGGFLALGLAYAVTDRVLIGGEVTRHRFDGDTEFTTFGGTVAFRF